MNKVLEHFKNNILIYLIILTCIVVLLVIKFIPSDAEPDQPKVDTSMFNVITLDEFMELFNDKSPKTVLLSVHNCSATENYVPTLQIAQAKLGFVSYYVELTDIDASSEAYAKFLEVLETFDYSFQGQTGTLRTFLGNTPLTLFIKDNKIVYGYYGSMSESVISTFVKKYGVNTRE